MTFGHRKIPDHRRSIPGPGSTPRPTSVQPSSEPHRSAFFLLQSRGEAPSCHSSRRSLVLTPVPFPPAIRRPPTAVGSRPTRGGHQLSALLAAKGRLETPCESLVPPANGPRRCCSPTPSVTSSRLPPSKAHLRSHSRSGCRFLVSSSPLAPREPTGIDSGWTHFHFPSTTLPLREWLPASLHARLRRPGCLPSRHLRDVDSH